MPTLLQINTSCNWGSTGRIAEEIALIAETNGWDCYIAHGGRYVRKSHFKTIPVSSKFDNFCHAILSFLWDFHGLGSILPTMLFVRRIMELKPDVIHLHNIHGYYINYKILFKFLSKANIPTVWTLHDCWAFTGHCAYFDSIDCKKWIEGCNHCALKKDYPRCVGPDFSHRNYNYKKEIINKNTELKIVGVSNWISTLVNLSFLKDHPTLTIHNGIDLNVFYPQPSSDKSSRFVVLGVASVWDARKGLEDFKFLRQILDRDQFDIVLLGLTEKQIKLLPEGITGIARTNDVDELRQLYSNSDVFVNPTYSDNFPTVNLEALACGIPVITYRTGGSPEAINEETGIVVEQGNVNALSMAIEAIKANGKGYYTSACRKRAEIFFDRTTCYRKYLELYNNILKN